MTERCTWCGRFVSYYDDKVMGYVPYGGYMDLEPPDEAIVCGKCWNENLKLPNWLESFKRVCWRGPYQRFPNSKEEVL